MEEKKDMQKTAFMLVCGNVKDPAKMGPYLEASGPLFEAAGVEEIAFGHSDNSIEVLEGEWPYEGLLMLYKCGSMEALKKFWNSPEYQEARKLRKGVVDSHFIVAIEPTR